MSRRLSPTPVAEPDGKFALTYLGPSQTFFDPITGVTWECGETQEVPTEADAERIATEPFSEFASHGTTVRYEDEPAQAVETTESHTYDPAASLAAPSESAPMSEFSASEPSPAEPAEVVDSAPEQVRE